MTDDVVTGGPRRGLVNRYWSSGLLGTGAFMTTRLQLPDPDHFVLFAANRAAQVRNP